MKKAILLFSAIPMAFTAQAAVFFVDLSNVEVPYSDDGVFINILTGEIETEFPENFDEAPWLNLYYGGSRIFTSNLLRPMASTSDYDDTDEGSYFLNLAPGTVIDSSGMFVSTGSVSVNHMYLSGSADGKFNSGEAGYLAFEYQATELSDAAYGWLNFTPNLSGVGFSANLAYSDTPGESLSVGAIPEPSVAAALAGVIGLGLAVSRRRRVV